MATKMAPVVKRVSSERFGSSLSCFDPPDGGLILRGVFRNRRLPEGRPPASPLDDRPRWSLGARRLLSSIGSVCLVSLVHLAAEESPLTDRVSFSRDLAPILSAKCLTCHSSEKAKGGYRLHTFAAALQPGKSKQIPVRAGEPEQSELFLRLISPDEDDRMPQESDPLAPEQVALFRRWIVEGAVLDHGATNSPLALLMPPPPHPAPPAVYARPVPVLALAWNAQGTELASGGYHDIFVSNREGALLRRITNVTERVHALAFTAADRQLLVAGGSPGRSGEAVLYESSTGERLAVLARSSDAMLCLALDSAGRIAAVGGADNAIRLIDLERRAELRTIQQHADWVLGLAFSADGTKLASASRDRTARVYDVATGELESTYVGHGGPVFAVAFADTNRVASAGRERSVHLWKVADGKREHEIGGFSSPVLKLQILDGQMFSIAGAELFAHKLEDRSLVRKLTAEGPLFSFAIDPAARGVAAGSASGKITFWEWEDGRQIQSFQPAPMRIADSASAAK